MKTRIPPKTLFASLLGAVSFFAAGCENENQRKLQKIQSERTLSQERRDSIREAFQYLPQLIRLDRIAALKEIRTELNTWSKNLQSPPEWNSPALLDSIAPSLRTIEFSNRLSKLDFGEPECEYLLQCKMLTEVCQWVLAKPYKDGLFADWLAEQQKSLSGEEAIQLESTLKLFDWAVCNISLIGAPSDAESLVTNGDLPLADDAPIYRQLPWQTMMFARGDRWQRARVFTQLLFSQGIDSIVLAIPSQTGAVENASLRLWCVAVPIGEELYLFEPQWGLPIPSQTGNGIATLKEAKTNPNVLRRANVPGLFNYPIEQKNLETLVALVDCEPFAVSRTMYTLERSLTGENRFRISMDADAFEARIKGIDGDLSVRLWNIPWLGQAYNTSLRQRLTEKSPFSMQYMEQFGSFIIDTPISRARLKHFRGEFESTIDESGALRTYMDFRVDEQTLKELMVDRSIQYELGIVRGQFEPMEMFEYRLQQAQGFFRRSKFDIGIFLAMANSDLGKPETAIDWLTKRTLEVPGTERWHPQAHYLLGRMYEQVSQVKQAAEEYRYAETPQAAGNRIRLRRLRQQFPTELADE